MKQVSRYNALLVMLHWLTALLILGALPLGYFVLADMPNANPQKNGILEIHMSVGMLIFGLTIMRFIVRLKSSHPPDATTGRSLLDAIARGIHYGFYVVVAAVALTGLTTAIVAGLNRIVFQGSGEPLPPNFNNFPSFVAHGYLAGLLAAMIALHVAAALYHQFVRSDGLMRRMGFGKRNAKAS